MDSNSTARSSRRPSPDDPIGVGFEVSFGGNDNEVVSDISQLSGGQKSIVAICFILSVQRCDPVPFYVFDEIDAALDDAHRDRVISYMAEREDVQFVCTTFRKEFVSRADQFIGVRFSGQASHASVIDKQEALEFVEQEDAARGDE
jgi:structural maintenance of chromosome 3 (chondroitin sulfate proteoglycan 6)